MAFSQWVATLYSSRLVTHRIGRYSFLLVSMFLMIGLKPFLDGLVRVELLADIFFSCVLISGIYALSKHPIALRILQWSGIYERMKTKPSVNQIRRTL